MRVLIISIDRSWFGRENSGDVVERHKEYAAKLGGSLDIIVFTKKGFHRRKFGDNVTVYPTNSSHKLEYVLDAFFLARDIFFTNAFDLIVTQDPFLTGLAGWLIKKRLKKPLLMHFHGDFWDNKYWLMEKGRWWFNWFFLLLSRILVEGADGIRVVSSEIKEKISKRGVDAKKIRVIPTPVNTNQFKLFDINKVRALKKENGFKRTLINVGRADPSKDYPTLRKTIELVCAKYGSLAFWQIGGKTDLSTKIVSDDNLILKSVDWLSQSDLVNYYYASDVYVSSSCHESFGKVLVEAMACGLPVVATATTGSKEIIEDGANGYLVPVGDSQALAKKIVYLLNNPDKAREMGRYGKRMVEERFGRKKIIGQVVSFWKELK